MVKKILIISIILFSNIAFANDENIKKELCSYKIHNQNGYLSNIIDKYHYFIAKNTFNKIMEIKYEEYGGKENYDLMNKATLIQTEGQKEQIKKFVMDNIGKIKKIESNKNNTLSSTCGTGELNILSFSEKQTNLLTEMILQNEYNKYGGKENYKLFMTANKIQFEQQKEEIKEYIDNDNMDNNEEPINEPEKKEIPKTDKPKVELFIMSYCPYGLQAQKGFLPIFRDFSKNADISIKFVHYTMHGDKEIRENIIQHCIQKEQKDKYIKYLECFLKKEGKGEECKKTAKLDTKKLDSCYIKTKKDFKVNEEMEIAKKKNNNYPKFNVDAEASKKYGVQGSPTLVINGIIAEIGRSPKDYRDAICNAFNKKPEACKKEYSDQSFDPMFGFTTNGQNNAAAAGCGN